MSSLINPSSIKHWFLLSLVMLILLVPGYLFIIHDVNRNLESSNKMLQQELNLLATLTRNLLQSGEYDAVQPIFDEWPKNYPNTLSITLITKNGYRIGDFLNESSSLHTHTQSTNIDYGYRGFSTLTMSKNVDWIYTHVWTNILYGFIIWLFLGLFGVYFVVNLQIQQRKNHFLEILGQRLSNSNKRLKKEQNLLRSLIDSIPDLIFFKDKDSVYMGCNKAFEVFSNHTEKEQVGKTDLDFFDIETATFFRTNDQIMMQTGEATRNEEWVTYPDNHKVLLDTLKTPYYDTDGNILGIIGISRDITKIKQFQEQLEVMAYHDALTNLPNRRFLIDKMQSSIAHVDRHNNKLAVCAIDLDGFKEINDRLGHNAGDKVLVEFSNRISNSLRTEDTVARWGGDEFTLLFTSLNNINECNELLERLQNLIAIPFTIERETFCLSASIGFTVYPDDDSDADILLRHADQAMYDAKLSGKNNYQFFDPEQNKLLHDYHEKRSHVAQAITNNELVLYYHPQIHLRTGAPYGVEALVRWNHPEKGVLSPDKFLPYIEEHELNIELDWWVMNHAVGQLQSWLQNDLFFHLSINVSAITFKQSDFVEKLKDLFNRHHKVIPEMVSLELLETAALGNLEAIAEKMKECQNIGVRFSLDDFGTGYSSLTYLSRLPADILKIDQTFIRDMLVDDGDASIVEGIIRLSSAFDRMVIAEGVEEIMHGIKLIEMGCLYAQGYAIAKPMPADSLNDWLIHFEAPKEWLQSRYPNLSVLEGGNGNSAS